MKYFISFILLLVSLNAYSSPSGDCNGTPKQAIVELPAPLSNWGQIICTPYGYIITNKEGWTWSNPSSYISVMIPSQMVREYPKKLGKQSYFTKIEMVALSEEKSTAAVLVFESGFDNSETTAEVYSLKVSSNSGKTLRFNFFDYGDSQWGMWCNPECDSSSKFMLLNLGEKPNKLNSSLITSAEIKIEGDIDCNGQSDRAEIRHKNTKVNVIVTLNNSKNTQELEFGLGDSLSQSSLCGNKASLHAESLNDLSDMFGENPPGYKTSKVCVGLKLEGGECDSIHIFWNHKTNQLNWWRL